MCKRTLCLFSILLLSGLFFAGCHHDSPNPDTPAEEQPDDTGNAEDYGQLVFTARGEKVTCSPSENQAVFAHDFHGSNYLTISGINRDMATNKMYLIKIDLLIQGELKPGTYSLKDAKTFADCLANDSGCDGLGQAGAVANKLEILPDGTENPDMTADKKALSSTGGTLKITSVTLGKYVNGFAEGKISGSFSFNGTNLFKLTGTGEGKFDQIPLLSSQ